MAKRKIHIHKVVGNSEREEDFKSQTFTQNMDVYRGEDVARREVEGSKNEVNDF